MQRAAGRNQLTSVTCQGRAVRRYHYEDSRFPQALTGITDETGVRWSTYSYDAQGRVARNEHVGGADRADFAYGFDAQGRPTTTLTDYPGGNATSRTYGVEVVQGILLIRGFRHD